MKNVHRNLEKKKKHPQISEISEFNYWNIRSAYKNQYCLQFFITTMKMKKPNKNPIHNYSKKMKYLMSRSIDLKNTNKIQLPYIELST